MPERPDAFVLLADPHLSFLDLAGVASLLRHGWQVCAVADRDAGPLPDGARSATPEALGLAGPDLSSDVGRDQVRFQLLRKVPGALVLDAGICLLGPLAPVKGYAFGWENDRHISPKLLALPPDSAALNQLAPGEGRGTGILGASALTQALSGSGEIRFATPRYRMHPMLPQQAGILLSRRFDEGRMLKPACVAVNLHPRVLAPLIAERHGGLPPRWSFVGRLLVKLGIRAEDAPLR